MEVEILKERSDLLHMQKNRSCCSHSPLPGRYREDVSQTLGVARSNMSSAGNEEAVLSADRRSVRAMPTDRAIPSLSTRRPTYGTADRRCIKARAAIRRFAPVNAKRFIG